MDSNLFWDKISALYYEYELTGEESFVSLSMAGGLEVILNTSSLQVGGDYIKGFLEDGTEIIISIDKISVLRYNPEWKPDKLSLLEEGSLI